MRWMLLGCLFVSGCYSEADFVPAKTDAFCAYLLDCSDPATIAFDGLDLNSCLGTYGPVFDAEGDDCRRFKRGLAKQCVAAITGATCPVDGATVEESIPEVCDFVYERCPLLIPDEPAPEASPDGSPP